jgi:hypothetical protein
MFDCTTREVFTRFQDMRPVKPLGVVSRSVSVDAIHSRSRTSARPFERRET